MIRVIYYCSYWFSKGWQVIVFRYGFVLYFDWTALPIPTSWDEPIRYVMSTNIISKLRTSGRTTLHTVPDLKNSLVP